MSDTPWINLWPDGCPHNNAPDATMLTRACRPAMRFYPVPERIKSTTPRAAILVCPGGGYGGRAPHEGEPFATLFNHYGIQAFVVDYRVSPHRFPAPYSDVCRAIRLVRSRAEEFNIDPNRIGLMGFSAGGHLASTVATQPDLHHDEHDDLAGKFSARPDRVMLGYPVISSDVAIAHQGSFKNLLGADVFDRPDGAKWLKQLSNELQVNSNTPPAFLFHTAEDQGVPPQNSLRFALACADAGVKCEYHQFEAGPHGVGMGLNSTSLRPWTQLLMTWLSDWNMSLR